MTSTTTTPAWEPPTAGDELGHLLGGLDRQRMTFRYKAEGLDAAALSATVGASTLTLGGLLKHLTWVEVSSATTKLDGSSPGSPWTEVEWDHDGATWDFTSAAEDSPGELYARYDAAVLATRERIREALRTGGLDQGVEWFRPFGVEASLRRLLFDLLEEYARHTGHADLLRESIDGRVGEDPPEGWAPPAAWVAHDRRP